MTDNTKDVDPQETQEWIEALDAVIEHEGTDRAHYLLEKLIDKARRRGAYLPYSANTAYLNTIPEHLQERYPGDRAVERRIRSLTRWNAMAMVVQANRISTELGGHIASFASSATLYDVGMNHFFHARDENHGGDLVFFQGHSAPGIYSRAYLEGRLSKDQMHNFRQEVDGEGLSSYPHPWLMPDFWQFPTVSMGLGPIMAIYQARFMNYLHDREMIDAGKRKVWAFLGDGETDEPESLGAITLAGREKLDNLVFVVNCNLQRLDGPVRGNGKIIQELEAIFRGAGWNVIKVVWGSFWDPLLARDKSGLLRKRMEECVDGDYQAYKARGGKYTREHFFGEYPELKELVANMSDEDIFRLNRGGHDPAKVFSAYSAAMNHKGQPTVILAKTVKGYGMGEAGEGQNTTHSQKKMGDKSLRAFRDRFNIPIPDDELSSTPFYKPAEDSTEAIYLKERREALGGSFPSRLDDVETLEIPPLETFKSLLESSGDRELSTTMVFVRFLTTLIRDKQVGKRVVPIVPDEARTFGMEGMFRQLGIYSSSGQLYEPEDSDQLMWYREDSKGQILQEGINEAGAMSEWIAAATAYSNHGVSMIPFYIYYSMFGFQRIGDLAWAAGDMQARGFLIGGTAGRTTLAGEGLQHQDGHGHLVASTIPNCVSYDPCFAYELVTILHDGMRRMYVDKDRVFYYVAVMNENYAQPAMPEGSEEGILKGMYRFSEGGKAKQRVQLLGSGTILREVIAAAELLQNDFGIAADVWSVTSFNELRRDGIDTERWNMLHPDEAPKRSYVEEQLSGTEGPVIAATDYIRTYADQIRPYIDRSYFTLGTDGFGRSDMREALRRFFEVNRYYIVVAALKALADDGEIAASAVKKAIEKYDINPEKPNPVTV
ncbi:pyruvate dehydrogenase (acetyl-transferring), homodimeric type [Solemya velum gill symbiont]|uniref:pyruvate dehydrogenase (acetyl-transferring), homodimeric type n=1 Tax=Solemya velum gill symbiont TaxID=2340 RepID=UPI000996FD29|nr:pyruvate dehydrogenase (acetyl-transferring), homodimeric type [Solemya velum gill symbiont]OOZ44345.1 pyruvate dehydrogenase (acetyl-transferring), homodimeric type [Solemya velum gill symbiont]OOZ46594.1 pyruvate dehydrogenase (acetyl-transferring), homodimeric type [Solemya velum gill symbiont]OOZ48915.1 pyruvate dehydrogenase (acetyl-transferring), homodimeric type [Solemya velum gill symbiont]OOZ51402.1 pyruvate dehydrogenase (acetyl-transferring), homodimeric type [Solemya velum gill s